MAGAGGAVAAVVVIMMFAVRATGSTGLIMCYG